MKIQQLIQQQKAMEEAEIPREQQQGAPQGVEPPQGAPQGAPQGVQPPQGAQPPQGVQQHADGSQTGPNGMPVTPIGKIDKSLDLTDFFENPGQAAPASTQVPPGTVPVNNQQM